MINEKNEELNEDELDQITGGVHGSASPNNGVVKAQKTDSKVHGSAAPNSGIRKNKEIVASGGGNDI